MPSAWSVPLEPDPTPWLLEAGEPWVRYRTLTDFVGLAQDDAEFVRARNAITKDPRVRRLIEEATAWPGYPLERHNDARHPIHALTILADFGLQVGEPGMGRVVGEGFGPPGGVRPAGPPPCAQGGRPSRQACPGERMAVRGVRGDGSLPWAGPSRGSLPYGQSSGAEGVLLVSRAPGVAGGEGRGRDAPAPLGSHQRTQVFPVRRRIGLPQAEVPFRLVRPAPRRRRHHPIAGHSPGCAGGGLGSGHPPPAPRPQPVPSRIRLARLPRVGVWLEAPAIPLAHVPRLACAAPPARLSRCRSSGTIHQPSRQRKIP